MAILQNKTGLKSGFLQWQQKQQGLPEYPKEYAAAYANLSDDEIVDAPYRLPEIIEANKNELFMLLFTSSTCEPCTRNKPLFAKFAETLNTPDDFKILCLSVETAFYNTDANDYPVYNYLQRKGIQVSEYPSLFVHLPGGTTYKVPFLLYADNLLRLFKVWETAQQIANSFVEISQEEQEEEEPPHIEKIMNNINNKGKLYQLLKEMETDVN